MRTQAAMHFSVVAKVWDCVTVPIQYAGERLLSMGTVTNPLTHHIKLDPTTDKYTVARATCYTGLYNIASLLTACWCICSGDIVRCGCQWWCCSPACATLRCSGSCRRCGFGPGDLCRRGGAHSGQSRRHFAAADSGTLNACRLGDMLLRWNGGKDRTQPCI